MQEKDFGDISPESFFMCADGNFSRAFYFAFFYIFFDVTVKKKYNKYSFTVRKDGHTT